MLECGIRGHCYGATDWLRITVDSQTSTCARLLDNAHRPFTPIRPTSCYSWPVLDTTPRIAGVNTVTKYE